MAIFETGATTSTLDLVDKICVFAAANGWIINSNVLEGGGRRAHLQLGSDVFINMRALVNESPRPSLALASGIAMNGSTGYNGANTYYNQPGAPVTSGGVQFLVGMMNIAGAMPAYFLHARGNLIICIVEHSAGLYQQMIFGKISKYGAWAGGTFCCASCDGNSNSSPNGSVVTLFGAPPWQLGANQFSVSGNGNGQLYATVDGNTGWCLSSNSFASPAMPQFFSSICRQISEYANLANTFNNLPVLVPVEACINRDGAVAWTSSTNFSIEGVLPDVYLCNLRYLLPAQQLDDGSGNIFRVYPIRSLGSNGFVNNAVSGWYGIAVKEN